jgi:hypothetical protein
MLRCSGVDDPCSWSGSCSECGCIFGELDQVAIFCWRMRGRFSAFIDVDELIPDRFEVDAVGLEVSCETAGVASPLIVPGGICITFSVGSFSACFGGMIVHFEVCAFVLLASISSTTSASDSSSPSSSATSSATATIATTEV